MAEELDMAYYADNPEELLKLSDEQQEAIFNGQTVSKDDGREEISEDDLNLILDDESAIESKDKEHTIPYEELKTARQSAHESRAEAERLKALAEQQAQLIVDLQAAKNQDAKTGGTDAQDAVMDDFKEEFSELLGENFEKYLNQVVSASVKPFQEKAELLEAELKEVRTARQAEKSANDLNSIKAAHSDVDKLTKKLFDDNGQPTGRNAIETWIDSLPEWDQAGKWQAAGGSVKDRIALIQMYKDANGIKAEPEAVKAAPVVKAKSPIKTVKTLSSMTGEAGEQSDVEAFTSLTQKQQQVKMASMSLEQQEALMQKMFK